MNHLTKSQQEALALDNNISVTAGAGSGKTRILVERFLKIVRTEPQKVRRILAITFTKKAAGEMQERVAEAVSQALKSTNKQQERTRLLEIRDQLNSANIMTIHGLCARILREYPLEAGLSPGFNEMDDLRGILFIQQAIQRGMDQLNTLSTEDEKQSLLIFSAIGQRTVKTMLEEGLKSPYEMQQIIENYEQNSKKEIFSRLNEIWLKRARQIIDKPTQRGILDLVSGLLPHIAVPQIHPKVGEIHVLFNRLQSAVENASEKNQLESCLDIVRLFTTAEYAPYKNLAQLGGKKSWPESAFDPLIDLSGLCSTCAIEMLNFDPGDKPGRTDEQWLEYLSWFLNFYKKVLKIYEELKSDDAAVDFEDLQIQALRLLKNNEIVCSELQQRYEFIMVDEFQDTNQLQWQIISLIAGRSNDPYSAANLFIVGDPKQSIYGFRSADVRVFKKAREEFAVSAGQENSENYPGNVVFAESFRFLPRLNGFINALFSEIIREDATNPFEVEYESLHAMRDLPDKGWIECALLDASHENDRNIEAEHIGQTIRLLISDKKTCYKWQGDEIEVPLEYGDIAILLRSRNHLLDVEQVLRQLDIPFKTVGGVGFWQKQEIYDFYHLLRFLINPNDAFALIAILRSKFFMIPDNLLYLLSQVDDDNYLQKLEGPLNPEWFSASDITLLKDTAHLLKKWLKCRERMYLSDLMYMIIADVKLFTILGAELNGEQLIANLKKLIEHAQAFESSGLSGLQDFINYLDDLIEREIREGEAQIVVEDSGTVKIMTIHAAKGLQFPVVFVPFLNTSNNPKSQPVHINNELGMAVKFRIPESKASKSFMMRYMQYIQKQKDLAEAKRLFYVAVTRASNYLFLSAAHKECKIKKESNLEWFDQAMQKMEHNIFEDSVLSEKNFVLVMKHELAGIDQQTPDYSDFKTGIEKIIFDLSKQAEHSISEGKKSIQPGAQIYSATRIMTYLSDRDEYFKRYHLGFFEHDYEIFAQDIYKTDYGLLKGKIVHRFLELIDSSAQDNKGIFEQILFEHDVFDPALRKEFTSELTKLAGKIYDSPVGKEVLQAADARNEVNVTMKLDEDYLTGTIDRMYKNKDRLWEIVDYKTNRISASKIEAEAIKYQWQMRTYALQLASLYPAQPEYPVALYFLHPDKMHKVVFKREKIIQIRDDFISVIKEIKQAFPIN